jgi:hypothetical protein
MSSWFNHVISNVSSFLEAGDQFSLAQVNRASLAGTRIIISGLSDSFHVALSLDGVPRNIPIVVTSKVYLTIEEVLQWHEDGISLRNIMFMEIYLYSTLTAVTREDITTFFTVIPHFETLLLEPPRGNNFSNCGIDEKLSNNQRAYHAGSFQMWDDFQETVAAELLCQPECFGFLIHGRVVSLDLSKVGNGVSEAVRSGRLALEDFRDATLDQFVHYDGIRQIRGLSSLDEALCALISKIRTIRTPSPFPFYIATFNNGEVELKDGKFCRVTFEMRKKLKAMEIDLQPLMHFSARTRVRLEIVLVGEKRIMFNGGGSSSSNNIVETRYWSHNQHEDKRDPNKTYFLTIRNCPATLPIGVVSNRWLSLRFVSCHGTFVMVNDVQTMVKNNTTILVRGRHKDDDDGNSDDDDE